MKKIAKFLLAFIGGLGAFLSLCIVAGIVVLIFFGPGYMIIERHGSNLWLIVYVIEAGIIGMYLTGYLPIEPEKPPADQEGDEYEELP